MVGVVHASLAHPALLIVLILALAFRSHGSETSPWPPRSTALTRDGDPVCYTASRERVVRVDRLGLKALGLRMKFPSREVVHVAPFSAGHLAGIAVGEQVMKINEIPVTSSEQLFVLLDETTDPFIMTVAVQPPLEGMWRTERGVVQLRMQRTPVVVSPDQDEEPVSILFDSDGERWCSKELCFRWGESGVLVRWSDGDWEPAIRISDAANPPGFDTDPSSGMIVVTEWNLREAIKTFRNLMVYAYVPNCAPCKRFSSQLVGMLPKLRKQFPTVAFARADVANAAELQRELNLETVPALRWFCGGLMTPYTEGLGELPKWLQSNVMPPWKNIDENSDPFDDHSGEVVVVGRFADRVAETVFKEVAEKVGVGFRVVSPTPSTSIVLIRRYRYDRSAHMFQGNVHSPREIREFVEKNTPPAVVDYKEPLHIPASSDEEAKVLLFFDPAQHTESLDAFSKAPRPAGMTFVAIDTTVPKGKHIMTLMGVGDVPCFIVLEGSDTFLINSLDDLPNYRSLPPLPFGGPPQPAVDGVEVLTAPTLHRFTTAEGDAVVLYHPSADLPPVLFHLAHLLRGRARVGVLDTLRNEGGPEDATKIEGELLVGNPVRDATLGTFSLTQHREQELPTWEDGKLLLQSVHGKWCFVLPNGASVMCSQETHNSTSMPYEMKKWSVMRFGRWLGDYGMRVVPTASKLVVYRNRRDATPPSPDLTAPDPPPAIPLTRGHQCALPGFPDSLRASFKRKPAVALGSTRRGSRKCPSERFDERLLKDIVRCLEQVPTSPPS